MEKKYHLMLKKIRLDKGLTQLQLAKKIEVGQSYISKYESGEQRLDLYELNIICKAMGISLVEFVREFSES